MSATQQNIARNPQYSGPSVTDLENFAKVRKMFSDRLMIFAGVRKFSDQKLARYEKAQVIFDSLKNGIDTYGGLTDKQVELARQLLCVQHITECVRVFVKVEHTAGNVVISREPGDEPVDDGSNDAEQDEEDDLPY